MDQKKGFTLIELLAVIVILAIIALVTTPITLNIINKTKEHAYKNSIYALIDEIRLLSAKQLFDTDQTEIIVHFQNKNQITPNLKSVENYQIVEPYIEPKIV